VRLIGENGEQLGLVPLSEALEAARLAGLDLAEIAPSANPPVVKVLDWGKYRYEQTKQQQKSRKHQKQVEVKQIRMGLKIGQHDLDVKLGHARRFLDQGHKVRVALRFRGREITHPELGKRNLTAFAASLADISDIEQDFAQTGRELSITLGAKSGAKVKDTSGNSQAS
jgi:translation initiation factor IF-3